MTEQTVSQEAGLTLAQQVADLRGQLADATTLAAGYAQDTDGMKTAVAEANARLKVQDERIALLEGERDSAVEASKKTQTELAAALARIEEQTQALSLAAYRDATPGCSPVGGDRPEASITSARETFMAMTDPVEKARFYTAHRSEILRGT